MTQEYKVISNPHNPLCGKSYEEVKEVVGKDGWSIMYVNEQTEELCKLAVQQDGYALKYVKNQTEEICRLAVQQDKEALQFVNDKFIHLFQE